MSGPYSYRSFQAPPPLPPYPSPPPSPYSSPPPSPYSSPHLSPYPSPPPPVPPCPPPAATAPCPDPWDYGFHRIAHIIQSPPYAAAYISIALFFLIIFMSDIILNCITFLTLGITVTLATLGLLALIVIILFIL